MKAVRKLVVLASVSLLPVVVAHPSISEQEYLESCRKDPRVPVPISVVSPTVGAEYNGASVQLEFVVDEKGRPTQFSIKFATDDEKAALAADYRGGKIGYGQAKKLLKGKIEEYFAPARAKRKELAQQEHVVEDVLHEGARKARGIAQLDEFNAAVPGRYLRLTDEAVRLASQLWARARNAGTPTADPKELDCDVLIAAQALTMGVRVSDLVVATTNVGHLSQFVPAELWPNITP